jgi:GntR family transcriptional regulator, transcriptional repressor for pyruvate dehydrogenase complex
MNTRSRPDLVSCVTDDLRRRILCGEFAVGDDLVPEGELASKFRVSRTVVREAMRNLRSLGLVEISQGRRPKIKAPDPEATIAAFGALLHRCGGPLSGVLEVRVALEGEAAALAAQRASAADLGPLAHTIAEMEESQEDDHRLMAADIAFHRGLAMAAGNPAFCVILDTLVGLMREHMHRTYPKFGPRQAIMDHRRILDAIRDHDKDGAQQALRTHMEMALRYLRETEAAGADRQRPTV